MTCDNTVFVPLFQGALCIYKLTPEDIEKSKSVVIADAVDKTAEPPEDGSPVKKSKKIVQIRKGPKLKLMPGLPPHKPREMHVMVYIIKVSEADERITAAQTPRNGRRGLSY